MVVRVKHQLIAPSEARLTCVTCREKAHMEFMQQEADVLMSFAGFDKKVI